MSLPTVSGTGFLVTDGVELKYSANGTAYARLPLVFKNSRRNDKGEWVHDKEILIQGTVFGRLAESLTDAVGSRTELHVVGQLYTEEYEGKLYPRMNIHAVWPVREDEPKKVAVPAGALATNDEDDDLPF